ncbi:hypothetical protein DY000_02014818 [Brassica cretica]|uniref:J domain-containing protein n=1 Tax=Brassica cretica TaxID=69181 RepID=A0ABQ7CPH5_BRACR|nr:hypothetical protein DY000_02014818 [Brassica cretica]
MASPASTYARTTCICFPKIQNSMQFIDRMGAFRNITRRRVRLIHASQGPTKPLPGVDTRIHWENPDDGWIGGGSDPIKPDDTNLFSDDKFAELIKDSFDSHYQFLGVSTDADLEDIKSAYRRLSKEYHPDTTSLPLKTASDKFMKLKEVYDVLSDEESRRFYDWTLAQEVASRQAEKMRMKLEDPKEQEFRNYESIPDMVDRLGGRNMELSDQAMTALTFDVLIIVFAVCCIVMQFIDRMGAFRNITRRRVRLIHASQGPTKPLPGVDTRIHWENPDDGWIGGGSDPIKPDDTNLFSDDKFAELIKDSFDSHYQFLGVSTDADLEDIKSAYRRLSKEYHPDTTSLPLKTASDKFMKLKEVYDVLSDEESRRFYDWTLAQEVASRQAEKMRMKLEDPKEQEFRNYESIPDMVDRLGGRNMELSDQAMTALTFDVLIIVFAVCCIVYVVVFKDPYY